MTEQDDRQPGDGGPDDNAEMVRRVNVALNRSGAEALASLAERTDMDRRELVNRALQVLDWVDGEQRSGHALVVRSDDGDQVVRIL